MKKQQLTGPEPATSRSIANPLAAEPRPPPASIDPLRGKWINRCWWQPWLSCKRVSYRSGGCWIWSGKLTFFHSLLFLTMCSFLACHSCQCQLVHMVHQKCSFLKDWRRVIKMADNSCVGWRSQTTCQQLEDCGKEFTRDMIHDYFFWQKKEETFKRKQMRTERRSWSLGTKYVGVLVMIMC